MTTVPALSVMMPVYNGEAFLSEAIDSIVNQTFADFEFIIVDNGSTDKTPEILASYANRDSRIRVHHEEKRGVAHAINLAVSLAKGRYIARMDADDISLPTRFQQQFDFLENHPEIGVLGGAMIMIGAEGQPLRVFQMPRSDSEIRSTAFFMVNPTVMMRKDAALAVASRQQLRGAIDYDFLLRALEQCQFANLDEPLLRYRIHGNEVSVTHTKNQVMSALAARAAASFRRLGRPDPLDAASQIDLQTLDRLGIDRSEIQKALLAHHAFWIELLQKSDGEAALNYTLQLARDPSLDRPSRAYLFLVAASSQLRKGKTATAALLAARAVLLKPSLAGHTFKRGFSTLFSTSRA
ncbi:MAG TPA: glycosyltransferase [Terriglobales bacterium]|nr:glycosyltransferase [Terriglobales bacterium]